MRKGRHVGNTVGVTTRKMTRIMNSCTCRSPVLYLGSVAFKRSENNINVIENAMWDFTKLGNANPPYLKNLDQLLVEIWKEIPVFVSTENHFDMVFSQASEDSEEIRQYYFKPMFWCEGEDCDEIISSKGHETKCVFCGTENNLSVCDRFSTEPRGKFLRVYPDRFKPFLACIRNWFEDLPTLQMAGVEVGVVTYNFGARVRRQLKVFPHVYHVDNGDRLGHLDSGHSNKCLPVPDRVRYEGFNSEKWYSNLFKSECDKNHVTFIDKNYLLGDKSVSVRNRSSAWV